MQGFGFVILLNQPTVARAHETQEPEQSEYSHLILERAPALGSCRIAVGMVPGLAHRSCGDSPRMPTFKFNKPNLDAGRTVKWSPQYGTLY